ncbi:hypothetical protein BV898_17772 [Hypsibius exemplaris]|uniref:Uncharacterized protein n=1 Tax=Hypsibius exemplaris TaxID=2072580 RepID=A0A9X6NHI4_HYPEX|nr:hypothetical protein BV898_17772 [Hypsibius exemplaris]
MRVLTFVWLANLAFVARGVDWSERYNVDPRRSALVWTTGHNISVVVCPSDNPLTTPASAAARRSADYNIALDLFPEGALTGDAERELRRREERVKAIIESVIGDTRIISQDRARLMGELVGEVVSKCLREAGGLPPQSGRPYLNPRLIYIDGLVLPLGGAVARLFLERPPPSDDMADLILEDRRSYGPLDITFPSSFVLLNPLTTPASAAARRSADYNIALDLFPEGALTGDAERELRRRERASESHYRECNRRHSHYKSRSCSTHGRTGRGGGLQVSPRSGASATNQDVLLKPSYIAGLVLPLVVRSRGSSWRGRHRRNMADRHLDMDLGANTFMRINSMHNTSIVRALVAEVHWEAFARYGVKLLGNTMSREEYLDAVGLSTGVTMSLIQQINGTVLRQDVITTSRKYVGNFLKAYLLMSNQYFSFMDHSIAWLADDIAVYTADDILRLRSPTGADTLRQEWKKYAAEANKGLKNMRLISVGLLLSYRNSANDIRFQASDTLGNLVPPSWLALKYMFPAV